MTATEPPQYYIDTASLLVYIPISVWLVDKYPDPFDFLWFLLNIVAFAWAFGHYVDQWNRPVYRLIDPTRGGEFP